MSSPTVTISSGVASWTITTTPDSWYLMPCFSDGTLSNFSYSAVIQIDGVDDTCDVSGFGTGWYVKIFGISGYNNLLLTPTTSSSTT